MSHFQISAAHYVFVKIQLLATFFFKYVDMGTKNIRLETLNLIMIKS